MKHFFSLAAMLLISFISNAQIPLPVIRDTAGGGKYITRTMHLLESSTAEMRNTVKILVYGQSISEQDWWLSVKQKLEKRYPYANLIMINRAIGGFASQMLWKTVEMDVTSFYPDLVLFHVYGSHIDYETIIRTIRSRTTAEVAIQTDHITKDSEIADYDAHKLDLNFSVWENKMSFVFEPGFAEIYKCELIQVRKHWIDYLKDNGYSAAQFLRDGVHLNDNGNILMAAIIEPNLRLNPVYTEADPLGLVKTLRADTDFSLSTDTLLLPFEGNKVDGILFDDASPADSFLVFVDGFRPGRFQGVFNHTRPYDRQGGSFPWSMGCWYYLQHSFPWNHDEEWSCTIKTINQAQDNFTFSVAGSITGQDGEGAGQQDFVSGTGRVIISRDDWHIKRTHDVTGYTVQPGYTFYWKTYAMGMNKIVPDVNPIHGMENTVTFFQGIPNTKHVLMLVKKGNRWPVKAIRVYRPYWDRQDTFFLQATPATLSFQKSGGAKMVSVTSNTCWKVRSNSGWLHADIDAWSENATIRITADTNIGVSRTDTLFMEGTGTMPQKIIVSQEGIVTSNLLFNDKENRMVIFPNPARDYLMVYSGDKKVYSYQIIDVGGKIFATGGFSPLELKNEFKVDLNGLCAGSYWLRVNSREGVRLLPFVITR